MKTIEFANFPTQSFAYAEAMNTLATNLSFCGDNVKTVLLTSRFAGEGKSFVAMNLMRTLASLQKRVVLLDADLRRSRIVTNYMGRTPDGNMDGLAHYLAGHVEMDDIVYATNFTNAYFIPIGREVSSSLQLLSSNRLQTLMDALRASFDVVLIDTPPVGMIVDALEMAKYADGAMIVVGYKRGRKQEIKDIVSTVQKTGCPVLGAVMNNVNFDTLANRQYYYRSERYFSYYKHKNYYGYSQTRKPRRR